ncbi:MAG: hypothetical protein AAF631_14855 [Pseudomonadota bacterium]
MRQTVFAALAVGMTAAGFLGAMPGAAEDQGGFKQLQIIKRPGQMPRVDLKGVEYLGAQAVRDYLGEDFAVIENFSDPVDMPGAPIVPEVPGDTPVPVPTQCFCPEDYVAGLTSRQGRFQDAIRLRTQTLRLRDAVILSDTPGLTDRVRRLEDTVKPGLNRVQTPATGQ